MNILNFIKKISKLEIVFKLPSKRSLLIFDDTSVEDLKFIIDEFDYFILSVRKDTIKYIIIHPRIIYNFILNAKYGLVKAYLMSVIKVISPKIILTNIDNSWQFSEIAKILNDKFKFFAIQNGARYDFKVNDHMYKTKITQQNRNLIFFIPYLFCFGDYESDLYKKFNIPIKKFYPVGSLKYSNYLLHNNINLRKKPVYEYDICLVSDSMILKFDKKFGTTNEIDRYGKYLQYIIKYVRDKNKSFVCAFAKINSTIENLNNELLFYKNYLNSDDYEFLINNSTLKMEKNRYLSYNVMLKSNLSVSSFSTMISEHLAVKRKIMPINFMQNKIFKFPINGKFVIENCTYEYLEKKISEALKLNEVDFINSFDNNTKYLMKYDTDQSTISKIKEILKSNLS